MTITSPLPSQSSAVILRRKFPQLLKTHGYSLTSERKNLLAALTIQPMTVQEIFVKLDQRSQHINIASIYRNLELFEKLGLVQTIQLNKNKKYYELVHKHHHHMVCQSCGLITNITVPTETTLLETITNKTGFQITSHNLEFFGFCFQCRII